MESSMLIRGKFNNAALAFKSVKVANTKSKARGIDALPSNGKRPMAHGCHEIHTPRCPIAAREATW
jgi:hypothetical protein